MICCCYTKHSYHRHTTYSASCLAVRGDIVQSPTFLRRESGRVRHAQDARVSRTGNEARRSIVMRGYCRRECRPVWDLRVYIWPPYCASVARTSVSPVTAEPANFATCGIRCTMPRWGAPHLVTCDMRRRRRASRGLPTRATGRRPQYCDNVPSARARRSACAIASDPISRKVRQNTPSTPTSPSTARSGASSIVIRRTARSP